MAETGGIRPIDCACGKAFIWANEQGIQVQCDSCKRRVVVPFESLDGFEHLLRFVERWRGQERR
jgi:hypothetical protein